MQKGNDCNALQIFENEGIEHSVTPQKSYSDNRELIAIAQSEDSETSMRATEQLLEVNKGLVRSIALRFRERGMDMEDVMQIGTIGLIKAVRSFDLERGTCFSTYAVPMIFGEIRRALRDDGLIKISRQYKKWGVELVRVKNRIISEEGREPHISELAEEVGISAEEAAMALDSMVPPVSLSDFIYGEEEGTVLEDVLADTDSLEANERFFDRLALHDAIAKMPDMWQKILLLRYFRDKTQQQVADALGLSQVKVSREEKKIVAFLRKELE